LLQLEISLHESQEAKIDWQKSETKVLTTEQTSFAGIRDLLPQIIPETMIYMNQRRNA